jgi:hypothetical protein
LIDRRWNLGILYQQSFSRAIYDLVVAKVRERSAVRKQDTQKFDVER